MQNGEGEGGHVCFLTDEQNIDTTNCYCVHSNSIVVLCALDGKVPKAQICQECRMWVAGTVAVTVAVAMGWVNGKE
jgi:hypothetical protein